MLHIRPSGMRVAGGIDDGRIRHPAGFLLAEEIRMMSPREMETLLRNVATKADLAAAIAPLATQEGLAEVRRHAMILNEAVRDDIRMLAEHVAGLIDQRSRNH